MFKLLSNKLKLFYCPYMRVQGIVYGNYLHQRERNMKRILLPALLAVSTLVGMTSLSNEVQAAGLLDDPDNVDIWLCVYKQHEQVVYTKAYNHQVSCPVYSAAQMATMSSSSQTVHISLKMLPNDHDCTVSEFGMWG